MLTIPTSLTVINETDVRGKALLALIMANVSVAGFYGFRSIGVQNPMSLVSFPCVMVDPAWQTAVMERLGKYTIKIGYNLYFYLQDSDPDSIVTQATDIGEALIKLFSNDALGDLGSPGQTNKFKTYPNPAGGYFWLNSDMGKLTWSTSYLNATPDNQQTYMRAGLLPFEIQDVVLK